MPLVADVEKQHLKDVASAHIAPAETFPISFRGSLMKEDYISSPKQDEKFILLNSAGNIVKSFKLVDDSNRIFHCNTEKEKVVSYVENTIPDTLKLIESSGFPAPPLALEINSAGYICYSISESFQRVLATPRFVLVNEDVKTNTARQLTNKAHSMGVLTNSLSDNTENYTGRLACGAEVRVQCQINHQGNNTLFFTSLSGELLAVETQTFDSNNSLTHIDYEDYRTGIKETYNATGDLLECKVTGSMFLENYGHIGHPDKLELLRGFATERPLSIIAYSDKLKNTLEQSAYLEILALTYSGKSSTYLRSIVDSIANPSADNLGDAHDTSSNAPLRKNIFAHFSEAHRKEITDLFKSYIQKIEHASELTRQNSKLSEQDAMELWQDPSTREYFNISDEWIDWKSDTALSLLDRNNPELSKKELKLLSARYLYMKGIEVDKETVNLALQKIAELRTRYADFDLIKGRNVVFISHDETVVNNIDGKDQYDSSGDYHRFGKKALIAGINLKQGNGQSLIHVRPEHEQIHDIDGLKSILNALSFNDLQISNVLHYLHEIKNKKKEPPALIDLYIKLSEFEMSNETMSRLIPMAENYTRGDNAAVLARLKNAKEQTLDAIANAPGPMTFIFDCHGGPDAIYFSNGAINSEGIPEEDDCTIKLTAEELARAYQQRLENYPQESRPTFILNACFNSNFIRSFNMAIGNNPRPIIIGASEYGQYSYSAPKSEYGNFFIPEVIGTSREENAKTTIKEVIERQLKHFEYENNDLNSNPCISVPDSDGTLIQISAIYDTQKKLFKIDFSA